MEKDFVEDVINDFSITDEFQKKLCPLSVQKRKFLLLKLEKIHLAQERDLEFERDVAILRFMYASYLLIDEKKNLKDTIGLLKFEKLSNLRNSIPNEKLIPYFSMMKVYLKMPDLVRQAFRKDVMTLNKPAPKPESIRPRHGFQLAHIIQNLPTKRVQSLITSLEGFVQDFPKKIPPVKGHGAKEDLPAVEALCMFLAIVGKIYSACLENENTRKIYTPDSRPFGLNQKLFLKSSQGIASYLKMKPENKKKFKEICLSKTSQRISLIKQKQSMEK